MLQVTYFKQNINLANFKRHVAYALRNPASAFLRWMCLNLLAVYTLHLDHIDFCFSCLHITCGSDCAETFLCCFTLLKVLTLQNLTFCYLFIQWCSQAWILPLQILHFIWHTLWNTTFSSVLQTMWLVSCRTLLLSWLYMLLAPFKMISCCFQIVCGLLLLEFRFCSVHLVISFFYYFYIASGLYPAESFCWRFYICWNLAKSLFWLLFVVWG